MEMSEIEAFIGADRHMLPSPSEKLPVITHNYHADSFKIRRMIHNPLYGFSFFSTCCSQSFGSIEEKTEIFSEHFMLYLSQMFYK